MSNAFYVLNVGCMYFYVLNVFFCALIPWALIQPYKKKSFFFSVRLFRGRFFNRINYLNIFLCAYSVGAYSCALIQRALIPHSLKSYIRKKIRFYSKYSWKNIRLLLYGYLCFIFKLVFLYIATIVLCICNFVKLFGKLFLFFCLNYYWNWIRFNRMKYDLKFMKKYYLS